MTGNTPVPAPQQPATKASDSRKDTRQPSPGTDQKPVAARNLPVQRLTLDRSDRVELVSGHVYRKSIGAEALGVSVFWMKPSKDLQKNLIPKHRHGEEMFYVVEGTATMHIEGVDYPIAAGDSLLMPAGVEHTATIESDELVIVCVENPPRAGLRFNFNDVTKAGAPLAPSP